MNCRARILVTSLLLAITTACGSDRSDHTPIPGRWYTAEQVEVGRSLFSLHCASCHGDNAEGTANWRVADDNGVYPPPPLNGSAHSWHHPLVMMERHINAGGAPLGGVMPGFDQQLTDTEIRAVIAYFQTFWPDDIYAQWREIDMR